MKIIQLKTHKLYIIKKRSNNKVSCRQCCCYSGELITRAFIRSQKKETLKNSNKVFLHRLTDQALSHTCISYDSKKSDCSWIRTSPTYRQYQTSHLSLNSLKNCDVLSP